MYVTRDTDTKITINIISEQTKLIQQLERFFSDYPYTSIHCGKQPITERHIDTYVLPAVKYSSKNYTFKTPRHNAFIVIAYGPPEYLKHAFLSGCIDYLKEPWSPEELYFRVLRHTNKRFSLFRWKEITFFPFYGKYKDRVFALTKKEYTILYHLVKNRGSVISRNSLAIALWGTIKPNSRAIDMHVSSIRNKLQKLSGDRQYSIDTIHGEGYFIGP